MDYIGNKCPVCNEYFHIGDDVVVCPDCGTPSHRECYIKNGRCINHDKHADGYDYSTDTAQNPECEDGFITCKKCGTKNEDDLFFCRKCNAPLQEAQTPPPNQYGPQQSQGQPFPGMGPNVFFVDPLGGIKPETDLGDGVTVGECAKLVKQNTPYFITVFNSIVKFTKSRFNFCAFLFGGGYLLYRKMYKLGTLLTLFQALVIGAEYYFASSSIYADFFKAMYMADFPSIQHHFYKLGSFDATMLIIFLICSVLVFVTKIVLGACTNRLYLKHCKKQIIKINSKAMPSTDKDKEYAKKGGVNVALSMSLLVSYLILSYIPQFFI